MTQEKNLLQKLLERIKKFGVGFIASAVIASSVAGLTGCVNQKNPGVVVPSHTIETSVSSSQTSMSTDHSYTSQNSQNSQTSENNSSVETSVETSTSKSLGLPGVDYNYSEDENSEHSRIFNEACADETLAEIIKNPSNYHENYYKAIPYGLLELMGYNTTPLKNGERRVEADIYLKEDNKLVIYLKAELEPGMLSHIQAEYTLNNKELADINLAYTNIYEEDDYFNGRLFPSAEADCSYQAGFTIQYLSKLRLPKIITNERTSVASYESLLKDFKKGINSMVSSLFYTGSEIYGNGNYAGYNILTFKPTLKKDSNIFENEIYDILAKGPYVPELIDGKYVINNPRITINPTYGYFYAEVQDSRAEAKTYTKYVNFGKAVDLNEHLSALSNKVEENTIS